MASTDNDCMKILPVTSKSGTQKFVVGDRQGNLTINDFTKQKLTTDITIENSEKSIYSISMVGPYNKKEGILVSYGNQIKSF